MHLQIEIQLNTSNGVVSTELRQALTNMNLSNWKISQFVYTIHPYKWSTPNESWFSQVWVSDNDALESVILAIH